MAKLRLFPLELMLVLVAFWHSVQWFVMRTADTSDEPWGLISLGTVLVLVVSSWNREATNMTCRLSALALALIAIYCFGFGFFPPLVRCIIALLTVGVVVWNRIVPEKRNLVGLFGLLVLSSPLLASLQFFFGFPLRLLVANAAALIIRATGTSVSVAGTMFEHQGRLILVDSPCSGLNMLWAAFYLCFLFCWMKQLALTRSLLLFAATVLGVIETNIGRTVVLVFVDTLKASGYRFPAWVHDAVGIASFICLAVIIMLLGDWLSRRQKRISIIAVPRLDSAAEGNLAYQPFRLQSRRGAATVSLVVASVVACFMPMSQASDNEGNLISGPEDWPRWFEGRELVRLKLSSSEIKFSSGFPGRMGKFTDGTNTILFRQVFRPTRQLHPSSDCYRGNCFKLHPLAALRDGNGRVWSRFAASKDGRNLEVREIVFDANGNTWSDTSSWYWSAILGKTEAPWTAVTVATAATDTN